MYLEKESDFKHMIRLYDISISRMVIGPEVGFTLRLGVIDLMREDGPSPIQGLQLDFT